MIKRKHFLSGCALLCCLFMGCDFRVKVVKKIQPARSDESPLFEIIEKASFEEFEKQVREHPEWVNQKSKQWPDSENLSVLTAAAITARTNYVRVLIENGADVEEALEWSKRNKYPACAQLILNVRSMSEREQVPTNDKPLRGNSPDNGK